MDRFPEHKQTPWMERSDRTWGTDLSDYERDLQDLDDRPSRLLLLLAERTGRRAPAATGTPGPDRPLSGPRTTGSGATSPSSAPEHNFKDAA